LQKEDMFKITPSLRKEFALKRKNWVLKQKALEKKDLLFQQTLLLSKRPILNKEDFIYLINNSEITNLIYTIKEFNLSNRDKEHVIIKYWWYSKDPKMNFINK
jgi:hypothetical protein